MQRWLRVFWIRLKSYEYWTWWAFFIPTLPVYLFYAIRLRSLVYFTAANPGIEYGGFFGEKKNEILQNIPKEFLVKSLYIDSNDFDEVLRQLGSKGIEFPLVFKPDVGERGEEVIIFQKPEHLQLKIASVNYPYILQEFVDYDIELGIFYARIPNENHGKILSVVRKKFLSVRGDGHSNIETLLKQIDRGYLQLPRLIKEKPNLLSVIPLKGEEVVVERIGNHCLGTEFINDNHLINNTLNEVFDSISKPFEGFFYGRYDLKIKSVQEMYEGKGIKIFELNGVTSEPGHIYDKNMSLFKAYRDLFHHQVVLFKIAQQNLATNPSTVTTQQILKRGYQHFFEAKR